MPNRTLKESICTSETIDKMTWFEECFFTRLLTVCDDHGRMDARPAILKSRMFPTKDRLPLKDIESALMRLADIGCIALYECEGRPYLYFPNWKVHNHVRTKKSRYPEPDNFLATPDMDKKANLQADANICKQMQTDANKCKQMRADVDGPYLENPQTLGAQGLAGNGPEDFSGEFRGTDGGLGSPSPFPLSSPAFLPPTPPIQSPPIIPQPPTPPTLFGAGETGGFQRAGTQKAGSEGEKGQGGFSGENPLNGERTAGGRENPPGTGFPAGQSGRTQAGPGETNGKDCRKKSEGTAGEALDSPESWGFGLELTEAFSDWLKYKAEKRQGYKATGLKALKTQVKNNAGRYGEEAVARLIRDCMAANWQGIIFDRLKNLPEQKGEKQNDDDYQGYTLKCIRL